MPVVVNKSKESIIIRELGKIIPGDGNTYVIPEHIAKQYEKYIHIIPESIVEQINEMQSKIREEIKTLEKQRQYLEEEKELLFKPFIKRDEQEQLIEKAEWKDRLKSKKHLKEKLDLLYSFQFDESNIEEALFRLLQSINSLKNQNVNICVCNTSKVCIRDRLDDNIKYFHSPSENKFCKPYVINLGVKKLIRTRYFIHSDIDLIYSPKFIEKIREYLSYPKFVRVIFYNKNMTKFKEKLDYETCIELCKQDTYKDPHRTYFGIAPGNGLIHLNSFKKIKGYDESYVGYGTEDADFNLRISYINRYILLNNEDVNTFHLWHPRDFTTSESVNNNFYIHRKKNIESELGMPIFKFFNEKKNLSLIESEKSFLNERDFYV